MSHLWAAKRDNRKALSTTPMVQQLVSAMNASVGDEIPEDALDDGDDGRDADDDDGEDEAVVCLAPCASVDDGGLISSDEDRIIQFSIFILGVGLIKY